MPYTLNPFTGELDYFKGTGGTLTINTITGNSGGALSPTGGNFNILGTGSITTSGSGSTLTVQLTGLTNHAVLIGAGTATITDVGPSASSGALFISAGAAADPLFSDGTGGSPSAFLATDHLEVDTSLAGPGYIAVYNTAASTSANAVLIASTTNSVHGDSKAQFDDGGIGPYVWSEGLLHGTSGNYVVSPSSTLGTNISFQLTQAGVPSFPRSPLGVASGGTGATTLTIHGVLLGETQGAIVATTAGSSGQLLIGSTGADPAFGTITSSNSTLSFTTGAASLSIQVDLSHANVWTGQQNFQAVALTDASPITWNLATQQSAKVLLTSGVGSTRQLQNPTNLVDGGTYILRVTQSSTGSNALTYGTVYKFPGGVAPTLSVANNAVDVLTFTSDGTNMLLTGVQFGYA